MEGVIVRTAGESDATGIAEVHARSGDHTYRALLPAAYLDTASIPDTSERCRTRLASPAPGSITWVAGINGPIAGLCHVDPSPDDDAGEDIGHIYAIYVEPRSAGQRIGRQVLRRHREPDGVWVLRGDALDAGGQRPGP